MRKVFVILGLAALVSCSPKIIEKVRTEYVVQTVHHRDTTYTRDSVYIREWLKGDTVWVEKVRDRYVYRDRWRDSVRVEERHDTTFVEKKVEKELTAGQKAKIRLFWWILAIAAGFAAWTFRKPLTKLVKMIF